MRAQVSYWLKGCVLFAALWNVVRYGSDFAIYSLDRCDSACGASPSGSKDACGPVEADLRVQVTSSPGHDDSVVWYRASIRNRSCRTLHFTGRFLALDTAEDYSSPDLSHSHIAVSTDGGARLPVASLKNADSYEAVRPYRSVNDRLLAYEEPSSIGFIRLPPGESVETNSEVFAPYRVRLTDVQTELGMGTATERVRVADARLRTKYAPAPPGFRRLVGYDLSRAGKYKARLEFHEKCQLEHRVPAPGTWRDRMLGAAFLFAHPASRDDTEFIDVAATSPEVEFEVAR